MMSRFHLGLVLTLLMLIPLSIAAVAPAGWVMLAALLLMLVMQLAAMGCFYAPQDTRDDSKPH
jgi:hypothetical protein